MRIPLRHSFSGGPNDVWNEGVSCGQRLLHLCVEGNAAKIPGRRGVPLNDSKICAGSSLEKALKEACIDGADAIRGQPIPGTSVLEFQSCHLHSGCGNVYGVNSEMGTFLKDIFQNIVDSMQIYGFSTSLSRYDLFHGHIFRSKQNLASTDSQPEQLLGILFHCAEYPVHSGITNNKDEKKDENVILTGIDLGYCQLGSNCRPSLEEWRFRNALWTAWWTKDSLHDDANLPEESLRQSIWLLDGESPEIAKLRIDGTEFGACCPNTVYEDFLGDIIGDIFLLDDQLYFTTNDFL